MKIGNYTLDEDEWKAQEEWRRKREVMVHNQMVAFLESLKKNKVNIQKKK